MTIQKKAPGKWKVRVEEEDRLQGDKPNMNKKGLISLTLMKRPHIRKESLTLATSSQERKKVLRERSKEEILPSGKARMKKMKLLELILTKTFSCSRNQGTKGKWLADKKSQ